MSVNLMVILNLFERGFLTETQLVARLRKHEEDNEYLLDSARKFADSCSKLFCHPSTLKSEAMIQWANENGFEVRNIG